jgi:hypothetical protein
MAPYASGEPDHGAALVDALAIGATPSSFSDLVIVINDQFPQAPNCGLLRAGVLQCIADRMGGDRGNAAERGHLKGEAAIW